MRASVAERAGGPEVLEDREVDAPRPGRAEVGIFPPVNPYFPQVHLNGHYGRDLVVAALTGNGRATQVGERTLGRAAEQKLVRLADGSGLWLTYARYLNPAGKAVHGQGVEPTVAVEEPDVDFGGDAPATDPILKKAIETLAARAAA